MRKIVIKPENYFIFIISLYIVLDNKSQMKKSSTKFIVFKILYNKHALSFNFTKWATNISKQEFP